MPFTVTKTPEERFYPLLNKNGPIPPHCPELGQCWLWMGAKLPLGYGRFWLNGRLIPAHWFLLNGFPGPGLEACHHCDEPRCCRPSHIFVGTRKANMDDCVQKGRHVPAIMAGKDNPFSKLTEAQAKIAKACPNTFGAMTRMAEILGVAHSIVGKIRAGKSWTHLPLSTAEDFTAAKAILKNSSKYGKDDTISAKLTEAEAILCKACPVRYGAAARMARGLGVVVSAVCNIRDGKNWDWLPPTTSNDMARAESFLASLPPSPVHWRKRAAIT